MSLTIEPLPFDLIAPLCADLSSLPLFQTYGLAPLALRNRIERAHNEGDGLLVARLGPHGGPIAMAWYLPRGAFGTGAYLRLLTVVAREGGKGVGSALMMAFERACDGPPGGFFVLTQAQERGAMAFYRRLGYGPVGELPNFVRQGKVESLLWKPS